MEEIAGEAGASRRKRRSLWRRLLLGAVLAVSLYVGSYLLLMRPRMTGWSEQTPRGRFLVQEWRVPTYPLWLSSGPPVGKYAGRIGLAERYFRPAHWIDRRLRSTYWAPRWEYADEPRHMDDY